MTFEHLLKSIENTSFDDMGTAVEISHGHWIVGEDDPCPVQLERLADGDTYLIYATMIRRTGEAVCQPFMTTLLMEQLCGHSLGRYGISAGPVTLTLYQRIVITNPASAERLAAMIACHRMLMECYIDGGADMDDDAILPAHDHDNGMFLPFRH